MHKQIIKAIIIILSLTLLSCNPHTIKKDYINHDIVKTGLDILFEKNLDKISGKNIALVTNHSGRNKDSISNMEMFLSNKNVHLDKILTPEHGFTGNLPDGTKIEYGSSNTKYPQIINLFESQENNLPDNNFTKIISLYGNNRKPTGEMLYGIDLIIYDIQDIGARFYTYISTMGLVMESAAEANIPVMVLDRPNPISHKIEGPLLDVNYKSFVGKYPIPIRYGMTVGELASTIIGENMIDPIPELIVIPMANYNNKYYYNETYLPWTKPSPNIPDLETAIIYPGACLIEATNVSEGRGTYLPFKQIGAPWISAKELLELLNKQNLKGVNFKQIEFTPIPISDMSKYPKFENEKCYGFEINITNRDAYQSVLTGVTVLWSLNKLYPDKLKINQESLSRLWGSDSLYQQLMDNENPHKIIQSYQVELNQFSKIRDKYLIYK